MYLFIVIIISYLFCVYNNIVPLGNLILHARIELSTFLCPLISAFLALLPVFFSKNNSQLLLLFHLSSPLSLPCPPFRPVFAKQKDPSWR